MPTLYERLLGISTNDAIGSRKIELHPFCGLLDELQAARVTSQEIKDAYQMTAPQGGELNALVGRMTPPVNAITVQFIRTSLLLGEPNPAPGAGVNVASYHSAAKMQQLFGT